MPTVAEPIPTSSTASTVIPATVFSTQSQSSRRVITPPTNQLSQLSIRDETPSSTASITQPFTFGSTQSFEFGIQSTQSTQPNTQPDTQPDTQPNTQPKPLPTYTFQSSPPELQHTNTEEASSSQHWQRWSQSPEPMSPHQEEPVVLGKNRQPSPTLTTAAAEPSSYYMTSPFPIVSSPPVRRRGRLFRTRSGNLRSAAEIRQRRELERHADELLDMILEGISDDEQPRTVTFYMNDVGRWRLVRQDVCEVEEYENP
ncbi:uncharacterized protein GGS25DRAFT_303694 [Hypoxylon fragiforme]|uniref:uncharacterized protein n=1 Tax=Hypoxylon fragiforme TaxID=63214 RepID=UPI0020C5D010|nr:uncharacterized protein GGS25DRAFT_303694 [Hypoxylon fragiforme]KAI2609087.1 hypothetical protein GGS25DRAFT_303694 [Hypoxylon fragiforme]